VLDDLYVCGVTGGGSDLAIAGQQRRVEHLGKRDVSRIISSERSPKSNARNQEIVRIAPERHVAEVFQRFFPPAVR